MRPLVDLPGNVDKICADHVFCVRQTRVAQQTHKRFVTICAIENYRRIHFHNVSRDIGTNRGNDSAIHRNQMRRELNDDFFARQN